MHLAHSLLVAAGTTATTVAGKSKSSNSSFAFLIIIAIAAVAYIAFVRPRQQRMRQQQSASRQLSVGDAVMSVGGIQGTVVALDSDVVEVEVARGVVLTFTRRAINPRPAAAAPAAPESHDDWAPPPSEPDPHDDDSSGPEPEQSG